MSMFTVQYSTVWLSIFFLIQQKTKVLIKKMVKTTPLTEYSRLLKTCKITQATIEACISNRAERKRPARQEE